MIHPPNFVSGQCAQVALQNLDVMPALWPLGLLISECAVIECYAVWVFMTRGALTALR